MITKQAFREIGESLGYDVHEWLGAIDARLDGCRVVCMPDRKSYCIGTNTKNLVYQENNGLIFSRYKEDPYNEDASRNDPKYETEEELRQNLIDCLKKFRELKKEYRIRNIMGL